jgi:MoxR-like ATPase
MMSDTPAIDLLSERLRTGVLDVLKQRFVAKDHIIDLMGVCLIAQENLFLLGPPGTAKSALVHQLAGRLDGRCFDYLLTRFTEPNELFGPFDIRKLRDGELVTNTEGMLPEAAVVFLDELLNANSAILNALLSVLNERVFRRGREQRRLPLLFTIGASNHLPEDDTLGALFDRFLLRAHCDNVPADALNTVLQAGWALEHMSTEAEAEAPTVSIDDVRRLSSCLGAVDLNAVRPTYLDLVHQLRTAGIAVSDRRAVKLQRVVAASALSCGRAQALISDLWVLRYIWDTEEQQEIIAGIVQSALDTAPAAEAELAHVRAGAPDAPDAEALSRQLGVLRAELDAVAPATAVPASLADQLQVLTSRCDWIPNDVARDQLLAEVDAVWQQLRQRNP